ncbi:MAG: type II secretion system protein GspD, partial [Synergistaceae bacterium]|nr:type II secretion system protein GspD [Synergistaceae bacterium]
MTRTARLCFAVFLILFLAGGAPAAEPPAETLASEDESALIESARRMRASGNVQFNFQDVDMVKFIRFMAELLNENLVLTPGV